MGKSSFEAALMSIYGCRRENLERADTRFFRCPLRYPLFGSAVGSDPLTNVDSVTQKIGVLLEKLTWADKQGHERPCSISRSMNYP